MDLGCPLWKFFRRTTLFLYWKKTKIKLKVLITSFLYLTMGLLILQPRLEAYIRMLANIHKMKKINPYKKYRIVIFLTLLIAFGSCKNENEENFKNKIPELKSEIKKT